MSLSSKRKGPWRHRCCHKLALILVTLPIAVGFGLLSMVLIRAFILLPYTESNLKIDSTADFIDEEKIMERAERLAGALKIPTISYEADNQEKQAILRLHQFLEKNFPLVHSSPFVSRDIVNEYSLLFAVQGTIPGKLPYLLASHLDVVPAEPKAWEVPPFSGNIINKTYIYGRGAIDDKSGVLGILEALEYIIERGEQPLRSFYIAFGHDEEVSGKRGAQELARLLTRRGVNKLDFVLDEGFPVAKKQIPGTTKNVAIVGVTEKGSVTLELSVVGDPGHASLPPAASPIGILAAAVAKLEEYQQPIMFGKGPESATFEYLAPYASFGYRLIYSNLWLFSGLMASEMEQRRDTRPFLRTTTAITKFNSGIKDNVIPPLATAIINHRVHPAQTISQVVQHDREVITDPRVRIRIKHAKEAHPVSSFGSSSLPFQLIAHTIKQIYDDTIVVPGVFIANTDTRWYLNFTSNLYRFIPTIITKEDIGRYHGNNERISIAHYHQAVNFYYRIIKNSDLIIQQAPPTTTANKSQNEL